MEALQLAGVCATFIMLAETVASDHCLRWLQPEARKEEQAWTESKGD